MTNPNDPTFNAFTSSKISGLTKREYFAAMAMQGEIAGVAKRAINGEDYAKSIPLCCELATYWADALIAELNKEPK